MKESKKGFWSTLFAPKKKGCCCDSDMNVNNDVGNDMANKMRPATAGTKVDEIIVLGPGCAKCKKAFDVVEGVISDNNLDVRLSKIEDITEMMKYNIMTTPAVVVDGIVRIKGHVPSAEEVKKILGI